MRIVKLLGSIATLAVFLTLATDARQQAGAPGGGEPPGMVLVPAGEFKLGSTAEDNSADGDEFPQRVIDLPAFYIDQFEVSNIEYKRFLDATGYPAPPSWKDGSYPEDMDFYPVVEVTWWDATAYARWMGKRLPTEEEWEKAARGPDGRRFPWGDKYDPDRANNTEDLRPVNANLEGASVYGAMDMAGNVAEWTASVYAPYPRLQAELPADFGGKRRTSEQAPRPEPERSDVAPASGVEAPAGTALDETLRTPEIEARVEDSTGEELPVETSDPRLKFFTAEELQATAKRVYRGGSFNSYSRFLRCANREGASPGARWQNLGFRCAQDAPAEGGKSR